MTTAGWAAGAGPGPGSHPRGADGPVITPTERQRLDETEQRLLALYENRRPAQVLAEVAELARQGPPSPAAIALASLAHLDLEQADDAARLAEVAVGREPQRAWLHHVRAAALQARADGAGAVAAQERAVQLAPDEPLYRAALSSYRRRQGDLAGAAADARAALALAPAHPAALNEMGLVHLAASEVPAAIDAFRQAQAVAPDQAAGHYHEGLAHLQAGDRPAARRCLAAALQRDPQLEAAEDQLALAAGGRFWGPVWRHLLFWGRFSVVGWSIAAFLYYILYRLLQMLWGAVPALYAPFRWLLVATLVYLILGVMGGRVVRLALRGLYR